MDKNVHTGMNRTGMKASPVDAKRMLEIRNLQDSVPATRPTADEIRLDYRAEADPVGSVPPPANIRGVVGTATQALVGHKMHILLDKLAERAAYERTGTRLYDAMLRKLEGVDALPEGLTVAGVQEIRDEELGHFLMLAECIETLGADPTAMTPCADLTGVKGMGLVQAMNDPRLTIAQALDTLLAAEVIDVASWEMLIELAEGFGQEEMAVRFAEALAAENRHEATVRVWLTAAMKDAAFVF
ncbi:MAG: ferritin-like domain-containing protein [Pseudomonadota bacterium]|nr:ferritin-like domain-containing protein [Pseudomonadota bacterium]